MTCLSQIQVNIERNTCLKNQPFESTTTGPIFQSLRPDLEIPPRLQLDPNIWIARPQKTNMQQNMRCFWISNKILHLWIPFNILLNEILFIYSPYRLQLLYLWIPSFCLFSILVLDGWNLGDFDQPDWILGSQWNFGSLSCEKGWFLVFLMKGLIPLATFFQKQTKPPSCLTTRWFSPLSLEPINQQDSRLHNDILVNWMFFSSNILYTGPKKSWNLNLQWWKLILNHYRRRNYIIQKG